MSARPSSRHMCRPASICLLRQLKIRGPVLVSTKVIVLVYVVPHVRFLVLERSHPGSVAGWPHNFHLRVVKPAIANVKRPASRTAHRCQRSSSSPPQPQNRFDIPFRRVYWGAERSVIPPANSWYGSLKAPISGARDDPQDGEHRVLRSPPHVGADASLRRGLGEAKINIMWGDLISHEILSLECSRLS